MHDDNNNVRVTLMSDTRTIPWGIMQWTLQIAALIAVSAMSHAAPSQTNNATALEEVLVTARKRPETLTNAPVAITALGARTLEQYNITRVEDMASLAGGGVVIADTGVSPTMSIRGVSSDSTNAGFDQSVGLIIDGVFYDRSRWTQQGFFDAAQVEILKGPQALFFGKSTVAGAVVLTTANPTEKFEGEVTVGHEFEANQWYTQTWVSGPITDTLGGRLALSYSDSDGWLKNQFPGAGNDKVGAEKEYMGRSTLLWNPTDNFTANFKIQGDKMTTDGPATRGQLFDCRGPSPFGTAITGVPADLAQSIGAYYPIADDCKLNDKITLYPGPPGTDFAQHPGGKFHSVLTSLNMNLVLGHWTLTSVTGWNKYTLNDETGYVADQGNISAEQRETNKAFSQEFRARSSFDGPLNFLFGINYQKSDFLFRNASQIILAIPDPRNGNVASQDHTATQDSKTRSVFGEITWDITKHWILNAGARYTKEEKYAKYRLPFVNENFQTVFGFPFWLPEGTIFKNRFTDDNVSPQVTLKWAPGSNWNLFASWRTGYLPGGFSLGATPQAGLTLQDFLFKREKVKGYEVGFKGKFLEDSLSVDIIAYNYKFTDLQVNVYVPTTASFVVGNAGEATTKGIEANTRWQATEFLQLHAAATYNVGEYKNYSTQCYTLQTAAQGCNPVTGAQDVSGDPLPRSPKYTFNGGAILSYPIGGVLLTFATDVVWSDKYQLDSSNSPFLRQDSYTRVDLTLAMQSADGKWKGAIIGRNVTDEAIATFGATRGFTNDQLATIQRLKRWDLEFTYHF